MKNPSKDRTINSQSLNEMYWALENLKGDFLKMKGFEMPEMICLEKIIDIFIASASADSPYRVYHVNLVRHESSSYILCDSVNCISTDGTDNHYAVYNDSKKHQWDFPIFNAMKKFDECKFTPNILEKLCDIWNGLNIKHLSCSKGLYAAFVINYSN